MTKEQMLEQWTRIYEQGYYKCTFTPKVYEYLDEKTDQIPETVMSGPMIYVDYDAWIIHELNGDNAGTPHAGYPLENTSRRTYP